MSKKTVAETLSMPQGKPGKQRLSDQYPCVPQPERRFSQRIGGDTKSMDFTVKLPEHKEK